MRPDKPTEDCVAGDPRDTLFTKAIKNAPVRRTPASINLPKWQQLHFAGNVDSRGGGHRARFVNVMGTGGLK